MSDLDLYEKLESIKGRRERPVIDLKRFDQQFPQKYLLEGPKSFLDYLIMLKITPKGWI